MVHEWEKSRRFPTFEVGTVDIDTKMRGIVKGAGWETRL